MAQTNTCDRCGATPAYQVSAAAAIADIVALGQPTGHSEAADTCADCETIILAALADYVVAQIHEQAPFQRDILALTEQRDVAQIALDQLPDADETKAAAIVAVADLETQRVAVVNTATLASDARKAAFVADLAVTPAP